MTMIVGKSNVDKARILTLRAGLKLECKGIGLSRHGKSCYAIVKAEFGFKGNKENVLKQLNEYIEKNILPKERSE